MCKIVPLYNVCVYFLSTPHLFVPSGLSDGGGLDDGLVATFDEDPVSSRNSVYLNLVSKKMLLDEIQCHLTSS